MTITKDISTFTEVTELLDLKRFIEKYPFDCLTENIDPKCNFYEPKKKKIYVTKVVHHLRGCLDLFALKLRMGGNI
jgi:hypothetical protein